jgi:hypothetical protein
VCDSVIAFFAGDVELAASVSGRAVEAARASDDPASLVWALAHHAVMASAHEHATGDDGMSDAVAAAEEALTIARRMPASVICLYPLAAVANSNQVVDTPRALEAAQEALRLDRTQRGWWAAVASGITTNIRASIGESVEKLAEWRAQLADHDERGERFLLTPLLATMGDTLATTLPELAADLAAIAESDAIAPVASFTVQPDLIRLVLEQPELVAAARARASTMSYDDAVAFIFAAFDAALADDA